MRWLSWTCGLQFMIIGLIRSDRNGTSDFIVQQLRALSELQAEQEGQERVKEERKSNLPRQDGRSGGIPSVPSIPSVHPVPSK